MAVLRRRSGPVAKGLGRKQRKAAKRARSIQAPAPRLTLKQEKFVRVYLETGNASEAYRQAYDCEDMAPATVNREAAALLDNPKITTRLAAARSALAEKHGVTIDWVMRQLRAIAGADIRKAVKWNGLEITEEDHPDGGDVLVVKHQYTNAVLFKNSEEIDDDTAAAISEVSQSPTGGLRVKFHDKLAALDRLGRTLGMFRDKDDDEPRSLTIQLVSFAGSRKTGKPAR
jgi:phage terminase small subunit